jgi:putative FmdB family regulatory protein
MPIYTYHCDHCDHEFEKYQSFSEDSLTNCPECSTEMLRKVYKPALVVFKGSGFYVTDTKSHSPTMNASNKDSSNGDKPSTSSEKPAEAKPKKKTETKAEKKPTKEK